MSASASVYPLVPLSLILYISLYIIACESAPANTAWPWSGSGSPSCVCSHLGWLKHRGLSKDPIWARLDRLTGVGLCCALLRSARLRPICIKSCPWTLLEACRNRCDSKAPAPLFRPELRQDYPLNLSISLSGGKETNQDCPSNGERTGNSPT